MAPYLQVPGRVGHDFNSGAQPCFRTRNRLDSELNVKQIYRILLGLSVVVIGFPLVSLAVPGILDVLPWVESSEASHSDSVTAEGSDRATVETTEEAEQPGNDQMPSDSLVRTAQADPAIQTDSDEETVTGAAESDTHESADITVDTATDTTSEGTKVTTTESSVSEDDHGTHSEGEDTPRTTSTTRAPKTSKPTPTPTTTEPDHDHDQSLATAGTKITGSACPCMVKGTTVLEGHIELEGDIMVDGGMLVARPGVDLDGNGHQIMFMNGGRADFQGTKVFTWSGNGSNANLKRDINFRNLRRIMFHNGAGKSTLKYFTVSNSGTRNIGDYPLHWHLNGNSSRGTIVEGVVVVNGKHHAFVPHGSHGITFKDTIAANIIQDAYWWDPPGTNNCDDRRRYCTVDNSNDIVYNHALAMNVDHPRDLGVQGHHGNAGFLLGAGRNNTVINSAAIDIKGGKNCSGFHWPSSANHNEGGNVWTFKNNFARSSQCHGIFVWQNDGSDHFVNGFSGDGIEHGAYSNSYDYRNIDVPYVNVHAGGWEITGGSIGTLHLDSPNKISPNNPTLRIVNTRIGEIVLANKSNNGREKKPVYVFDNVGLSCGDVNVESVEPGTSLKIDGAECLNG